MPAYEYTAVNPKGKETTGLLEGDSPKQIRQSLRGKGLIPVEIHEVKEKGKSKFKGGKATSRGRLKAAELALFTRQLSTLLQAGTPLENALGTIANQHTKKGVKRIILGVRSKVTEGHSLADSLNQFPSAFPGLYRSTVAAGENSGHLDKVLDRLADYTEGAQEMQQKITSALIYPVLLTVISIAVVAGLLGYVVPQVIQVFDNMGQELPVLTRGLIAVSEIVQSTGVYVVILAVLAAFVFAHFYKKPAFERKVDRFTLRLPIVGNIVRGKNTAAFARTLSILSGSGVSILTALRNAADVVSNRPMREAIQDATERVREGAGISSSLQKTGLFPPMTLHLIASGEGAGKLDAMLERAAEQQERETSTTITSALSLFEPMLILLMGAVVLVIVLAILLPIFELNQLVGQ